jgi:hypothetical protein
LRIHRGNLQQGAINLRTGTTRCATSVDCTSDVGPCGFAGKMSVVSKPAKPAQYPWGNVLKIFAASDNIGL